MKMLRLGFCGIAVAAVSCVATAADEVRWDNQGGGDISSLARWFTHNGDWNFNVPVTAIDNESDLRFYSTGEFGLTQSSDITVHSIVLGANGGNVKATLNGTGRTISFADSATAPEWGDWAKGLAVNGSVSGGQSAWLVISGGTLSGNCFLRAAAEGNYDAGNARLTVTGAATRVEGVMGDVTCGDSSTNCVLEVLGGAYVRAGRALRNGDNANAAGNTIRVSGAGSLLEMRPTADASYLPNGGFNDKVIVENGGTLANIVNSGDWYGTTYLGGQSSAHNNEIVVRGGGVFDLGSGLRDNDKWTGGELRIGFNSAHGNRLVVDGAGSAVTNCGQLAVGSAAAAENSLVVTNGGRVLVNGFNNFYVGWNGGSDRNRVTVSGTGSELSLDYMFLYIGADGGCSNVFTVADGGKASGRHFFIGTGTSSAYNTVNVTGAGSQLLTTAYDYNIGNGGHHNTLNVEDGAYMYATRDIFVGGGEGADVATSSNNVLRIYNATLNQPGNYDIQLNNHGRLVVGGSNLSVNTPWLHATGDSELEFVFDENGIAPFKTRWETFLANADGTPSLAKITVDATKFTKAHGRGEFTLMYSEGGHACRRPDGSELDEAGYAALNAALAERVECIPDWIGKPEFDMAHSRITISIPRHDSTFILLK